MQFQVGDKFKVIHQPPQRWYCHFMTMLANDEFQFEIESTGLDRDDNPIFYCKGKNDHYSNWYCSEDDLLTAIEDKSIVWLTAPIKLTLQRIPLPSRINSIEI